VVVGKDIIVPSGRGEGGRGERRQSPYLAKRGENREVTKYRGDAASQSKVGGKEGVRVLHPKKTSHRNM